MEAIETLGTQERGGYTLQFDLGTFEGFNFREDSAIEHALTGDDVINWDHDAKGEAEFWPSGDNAGVSLLFKDQTSVTGQQLLELDRVLQELSDDSVFNFLRIHHAMNTLGDDLRELTAERIEDLNVHVFTGDHFIGLRKEAAFELFELYYPEAYAAWEKCCCDGLIFGEDRFLDSPVWSVDEVEIGNQKALIIAPQ